MTRAKKLTTVGVIQIVIAMAFFLTLLFSRPVTATRAVLGITSTATLASGPTSTPVPQPTSTLAPITPLPSPTSPPAPTSRPSEPKATSVAPTPTPIPILPLSGGEAGQSDLLFWAVGSAILLIGWLFHFLRRTHSRIQN
ncbi:MAG: hypothetical protein GY832_34430 [Chloroflexi bacterium]|nr:hypothetical protein [Chloroflexota bacterium]